MAELATVKIKSDGGYTVINSEDFDMNTQELHLDKGEIIVKPLGVADAAPFVIDEKDFDPKSYEKVSKTKSNLEIVADQTPRETLAEKLAPESGFTSINDNEYTREFEKGGKTEESSSDKGLPKTTKHTPSSDLKRNQQR